MRRILCASVILLSVLLSVHAQSKLDLKLIKETVENESGYYNDILNIYLTDDPLIRLDDIALVYYGQVLHPTTRAAATITKPSLRITSLRVTTEKHTKQQRRYWNTTL